MEGKEENDRDSGTEGSSTGEGRGGEKDEMQIWMMVNSRMRTEKHWERMGGRKK